MSKIIKNSNFKIKFNNCGDIASLEYPGDEVRNILAQKGMCAWLKHGKNQDPSTGVFSAFMDSFHSADYQVKEEAPNVIIFSREALGIRLSKKFEIGTNLKLTVEVKNISNCLIEDMQIEFHNIFATPPIANREMDYSVLYPNKKPEQAELIQAEKFGQRFVKSFPCASASHRFGRLDRDFHLKLDSEGSCEALTAMIMGRVFMRGFNSVKFSLNPGEQYSITQVLRVEPKSIRKFIPESKPNKSKSLGSSSAIMNLFKGQPVFNHRWSHICLQYDAVNPETLRKIIGELLAPLRYTGIILELNRSIITASHPELAAEWAMSISELKSIVKFIRSHGMKVGFEFNTPGHQNETGIADLMPELLEPNPNGYKKATLCLSAPRVKEVVGDIFRELVEVISPDIVHLGADEAQFDGYGNAFGNCPLCKGRQPHQLFGEYIQWLYSQVAGVKCVMFGDMFIQSKQFGAACSGNGSADDVWKSLELIPQEIDILDWHYYPAERYGSLEMFKEKGFKVWPVTAFHIEGMHKFLAHAEELGLDSAMHTTWTVPSQEKFTIESVVWAGAYHWLGCKELACDELESMTIEFCREFWRK